MKRHAGAGTLVLLVVLVLLLPLVAPVSITATRLPATQSSQQQTASTPQMLPALTGTGNTGHDSFWENPLHWLAQNLSTSTNWVQTNVGAFTSSPLKIQTRGFVTPAYAASKTMTANGNAQLWQGSSGYFSSSTSDYLSVPESTDFHFGAGDFTIDFWMRIPSTPSNAGIIWFYGNDGNFYDSVYVELGANRLLYVGFYNCEGCSPTAFGITSTTIIALNAWYHVAFVRSGSNLYLFINGSSENPTTSSITLGVPHHNGVYADVGACYGPTYRQLYYTGWLDEFRVSKGIARWTSNFTPPTGPYTADANTVLLLHMDGPNNSAAFWDGETTPKTVTTGGSAKTSTAQYMFGFTKFGSAVGVFDGAGDYLSAGSSTDYDFATGEFTLDFWILRDGDQANYAGVIAAATNTAGWAISFGHSTYGSVNKLIWWDSVAGAIDLTSSVVVPNLTWTHVAVVRSGNTVTMYFNGSSVGSYNETGITINSASTGLVVGRLWTNMDTYYFNGWMDEVRISKGIARWTSNFTSPASAYSADCPTVLLLHMDGTAGSTTFTDSSGTCLGITTIGSTNYPSSAQISLIQTTPMVCWASGSSYAVTLGSTPANGDTLLLFVVTRSSAVSVSSISQTGAFWVRDASQTNSGSPTGIGEIWRASNVSGASTTITIMLTGSPTTFSCSLVAEYAGLASSPVDMTTTNWGTSSSPTTGTTGTTTQANELWFAGLSEFTSPVTISAPASGFAIEASSTLGNGILDKIVSSTGAASTGATENFSAIWVGLIVTYKAATSQLGTGLTKGTRVQYTDTTTGNGAVSSFSFYTHTGGAADHFTLALYDDAGGTVENFDTSTLSSAWTYSQNGAAFSMIMDGTTYKSNQYAWKVMYPGPMAGSVGYYGRISTTLTATATSATITFWSKANANQAGYWHKQAYFNGVACVDADTSDTNWDSYTCSASGLTVGNSYPFYVQAYVVQAFSFATEYIWFDDMSFTGVTLPSGPHHRLWHSASTSSASSTWNVVNYASGTPDNGWTGALTHNAYYWLMWQWDSTDSGPSYTAGAGGTGIYKTQTYGSLDLTWSEGTTTNENWSMYLTYNLSPQTTMTVSYQINGGGSPTAPVFNYVQGGNPKTYTLTGTAAQITADTGSSWSVTPNPLTGSGTSQQWYATPSTLSGTASGQTTVFTFYNQYAQTLSYSVSGGGTGYSAPQYNATQCGSLTPQALTTSATPYWYDSGSSWIINNPLAGSGSGERWTTTHATSGTVSSAQTIAFTYLNQYYLTMTASPPGGGTISPSSGWQNSTTIVAINATPGGSYAFASWTGIGAGGYNGTSSSSSVTMNGAVAETANFNQIVQITVASSPTGGGYVTVDGIPITTPQTYSWVVGASHNLTATASAISCGTGCQLVWQSWSDSQARSHLITVPSSATTYTATFKTQYRLTFAITPSGGGSTTPAVGSYWYDSGSIIPVNATASTGYSFASWSDNGAKSHSVTVSQTGTLTANFVSVDIMTVSYTVTGGGSPTAPTFACIQLGTGHQFIMSIDPTQVSCDAGTPWSVTPNPLTGSGSNERWSSSQDLNGTVSAETLVFTFYHQYRLTLSYSVSGGSSYSAPTFTATRYGSSAPETLSSPASYWFDSGSSWSETDPLAGSGSSERWHTLQTVSGTVTASTTVVFIYAHQFSLTMAVSPTGGGSTVPYSGWENDTASVQISASASGGYAFVSWSGSGNANYTGTNNPAFVEVRGPITETANFLRPLDHFVFSTISSPQVAGVPLQITITAVDSTGGTVTGYGGTNTLSDSTGTISPTSTGPFSGGIWTGNVTISHAQQSVSISTSGGGKTGTSNSFNIDPAALDHFVFGTITTPQTAGTPFQINITAVDASGNTVLSYAGTNTLSDTTGTTSPASTGPFSSGAWTGSITITKAQSGVTVSTSGGGKTGTSNSFTVEVGALDHFVFGSISSPKTAGTPFTVTITAVDANGNTVASYGSTNSLGDSTGTLTPTSTGPFSNGVWSGSVTITKTGSSVTATTSGSGKTGTSGSFAVSAGPLDHFVFATINSPQTAGTAFQITITALDSYGNTAGYAGTNSLSVSAGNIAPTSTGPFSSGTWTGGVTLSTAGSSITIGTSGGGKTGTSNIFTVNADVLDHFTFSTVSTPQTAGAPFQINITAVDAGGNKVTGYAGTNTLTASVGNIAPTSTGTFSGGAWTGSVTLSTAGTSVTVSTSGGGKTGTSNPFTVNVAKVTMRVSYQVLGGGTGYAPPIFNYVASGAAQQYNLTTSSTGIQADDGSAWSVTPNPLTGSGSNERWISSQTLSGTATTQTIVFTFQHQYYLTTSTSPSGAGSVHPSSGWQDAGGQTVISASSNSGYVFSSWSCTGSGCYSGTNNPASLTVNEETTETAVFTAQVTMTVSYAISGGGLGYSAPTFHYVQNATSATYELTGTATGIQCDVGSAWSVTSNPLTGSGLSEQWYSGQSLSGTATTQTLVFTFQHQYYLTMQVSPFGAGTTLPVSGWQNSGASEGISATSSGSNYSFMNWTGTGAGNYTGTSNPSSVTVNSPVTETANFVGQTAMTISYVIIGGGTGYSPPMFVYSQGGQNRTAALTETPTAVAADSGSAWAVTPCPLSGSSTYERWYSNQALTGSASGQTLVFSFSHQYYLTVLADPPGGGSVTPSSGWKDADSQASISATAASGYAFASWSGTGSGSYSGTNSTAQITLSAPITETASFIGGTLITMTVNYQVVGGGSGYSAPIFSYVQAGVDKNYTLTTTPTGIATDSGSAWSVTPNPLPGSASDDRWYSSDVLSGTASTQTLVFSFQYQHTLTLGATPPGGGTTAPMTGWQNAGASVAVSASPNPGYVFQDWSGSGSGSYSGTSNPSNVTMQGAITEMAEFTVAGPSLVTMTVNYSVLGGGSPAAPVFNYVQGGVSRHAALNQTSTGVQCDGGSAWSVTPNPLADSDSHERWTASQALSGTASTQSKTFSFQHQYYLATNSSPPSAGSTTPLSGWQNSGTSISIRATPRTGYAFESWSGSGSGSYSGASNPTSFTLSGAVNETASFSTISHPTSGIACSLANQDYIGGKVQVFSVPATPPPSPQQLLLPLSQVLPASGLVANRRARRGMRGLISCGKRGGLSTLASIIILCILVAGAIIGVAAYYYSIGGGATSQTQMIFTGSGIVVDAKTGSGTVYVRMYNEGASAVRVRSLNITAAADFSVDFSSGLYGIVYAPHCNCTISGGAGVGVSGTSGNGFLSIPAGTTTAILVTFTSGMTDYFEAGTRYQAMVVPVQAADIPFTIAS